MQKETAHIFFFPFMSHGHMIPSIDMAKLFSKRGLRSTIITTPLNALLLSQAIQNTNQPSTTLVSQIEIKTINFPCSDRFGLPQHCENIDSVPSQDLIMPFYEATAELQEPLEQLLNEHRPTCLVADMFFPWATDAAAKFGIPRLVFHGTSFLSLSAWQSIKAHGEAYRQVSSDFEPFMIPDLPGEITLTRMELPEFVRNNVENYMTKLLEEVRESEVRSYGVVVNSFYDLEPEYADHYVKVLGRKAWHIGPVSLCNRDADHDKEKYVKGHKCLKWLDSKRPNSIVYVCFGSVAKFTNSQVVEIALGLEASGHEFIWVVRTKQIENFEEDREEEEWVPKGFEKRMEGKGLIIRDWAPQVEILEHEAIGGFVTHCGWNSTLEGVSSGVPMVTWPMFAEQFFNEKLVTKILRIGVGVGVRKWVGFVGDSVKREAIEKAVRRVMEGEEAMEMRGRAKKLSEMAKRAVEQGGSSYCELTSLIEELSSLRYEA